MREMMWRGPIYIYAIAISRPYVKLEFTTHTFFSFIKFCNYTMCVIMGFG